MLMVALVSCQAGSSQAAAQPAVDVAASRVAGAWALTVTVTAEIGRPAQSRALGPGHTAVDTVWFESVCPTAGHCNLQLWGPSGPNSQEVAYYQYFGTTSGLVGPPVSVPMAQSGDSYSADIPISGFGGLLACQPPRNIPVPNQHLTIRVTDAYHATAGWQARRLVGTESLVIGWGCNGTTPTDWVVMDLGITGHAG